MSVINFTVKKPFGKKVDKAIKEQGFTSKAEFFRFSALFFIHNMESRDASDNMYETVINQFANIASKKFKNKKLPSLEEQFDDIR